MCADFDELKLVKINLHKGDGEMISNTIVKCYLDEEFIDKIRTSFDGQVVIKLRPEREGKRKLIIRDNDDLILSQKTLHFTQK